MHAILQDLRQAARSLARSPGFTAVAVLTLALGIGANGSIFSLVNAVMLSPLPFRDPGRLVVLNERRDTGGDLNVDAHEFATWHEQGTQVLESAGMYGWSGFNFTGTGDPVAVNALTVSAGFFDVLGLHAAVGRTFLPGEDQSGAEPRTVLSHHFWTARFGGDSAVVGRDILLDDRAYHVIGVAPPSGEFDPDLWVPVDLTAERVKVGKHTYHVIARLKPGITMERAQADLNVISERLEAEAPAFNARHRVRLESMYDAVVGDGRRPVLVALAAVGFVLLIACANVAHLLLTRGAGRRLELALRAALGAGRRRLVGHLLAESVLLALAGGVLGLVIAAWTADLLPSIHAVQIARMSETRMTLSVGAAVLVLSLFAGLLSGLMPALRSSRLDLRSWLADGTRASVRTGRRIADALVVSEIALALMLLVGAGLMVKSFVRLTRVDPGFEPRRLLMLRLALPAAHYRTPRDQVTAFDQVMQRIRAIPGVAGVGASTEAPLHDCCDTYGVTIEGMAPPPPGEERPAMLRSASPDYFRTLGVPLKRGRLLTDGDARVALPLIRYWEQAPYPEHFAESQPGPVAVINEAMARRYWPGADPVGKRFRILFSPWIEVVGVVGDVRHTGLGIVALPEMFLPYTQEPRGSMAIMVRAAGDPSAIGAAVREQVSGFDRQLPLGELLEMEQVVHDSLGRPRFNAVLLGVLAGLALVLALVGIYGVIAYSVAQRTHEIGVRTALGAGARDVVRLVLGRFAVLTGIGVAAGLAGAFALTRLLGTLLYDVKPTDPAVFLGLAALIAGVAMLACYLPTRRATRIDPLTALRSN